MALTEGSDSFGVLEGGRRRTFSPKNLKRAALYGGAAALTGGVGVGILAARAAYKKRQAKKAAARKARMAELSREIELNKLREAEAREAAARSPRAKEVAALHGFGALYEEEGLHGKLSMKKLKGLGKVLKPFSGALLTVGKFVPGVSSVIAVGEKAAKYGGPLVAAAKKAKAAANARRKALGLTPVSEQAIEQGAQAIIAEAARTGKPVPTPEQAVALAETRLERSLTPGSPQAAAMANEAANEDAAARADASAAVARKSLVQVAPPTAARPAVSPMRKYAPWIAAAAAVAAIWAFSRRKRS